MKECKVCGEDMCFNGLTVCPNTHFEKNEETGQLKCQLCDFQTENLVRITEHQASHTGETPFQCSLCEKEFATRTECLMHFRFMHSSPELQPKQSIESSSCLVCGSSWDPISFECSKNHTHWHDLGNGLYRCGVEGCPCKAQMPYNKLLEHLRFHTNARPYPCRGERCGARFRSFYERKTHEKECRYKCAIKRSRDSTGDNEETTVKKLKTEKRYECIVCKQKGLCKTKNSRCTTCAPYVGSSFREQAAMKAIKEELGVEDLIYGPFFKQYQIPGMSWRVDGYSPKTKSIYEYHSARHHGETNVCVSRLQTLRRMDNLCAMGYKVFSIWGPSFLKRSEAGLSMKHYLVPHVPPPNGEVRPLPTLEADESFLVTVIEGWIKKKGFEETGLSKVKGYLGNLVDYAIDAISTRK